MIKNTPDFRVYAVEKNSNPEAKDFFHPIGVGWKHKDGKGVNLSLSALPLSKDVCLREFTDGGDDAER